jgi:hypothetical protein
MHVVAIMATCGRHHLCERSLRFFLDQTYDGEHTLLIYNNSHITQEGGPIKQEDLPDNKHLILVNQCIDKVTGEKYNNLGAIYRDALEELDHFSPADIIIHWDDDDIFLPNHISEGVKGYIRALDQGKLAYKPSKSYYRHSGGVQLMSNTLEPSIFVRYKNLKEDGYSLTTSDQHLQWVNPLVYNNKILVDENGTPTLIYNWGDVHIPTFKTSGNATHPENFNNYRAFSKDHGDGLIIPWKKEDVQEYYDLVKNL